MSDLVTVQGMILSAMNIGDYDKRIVLLTRERGKISAFAKGVRRQGSSLMAACSPFAFGTFTLYEGKSSYNLRQAEISHYFTEIAEQFPGIYYGYYFLEIADYFGREGNDEKEMMNLLYVTLKAILNPKIPDELIRIIFEFRTLVIQGEYPDLFHCVECGEAEREKLLYFSEQEQGIFCEVCGKGRKGLRQISLAALYTLQYITVTPLGKLYGFQILPEVLEELKALVYPYFDKNIDKRLKSLDILKIMAQN